LKELRSLLLSHLQNIYSLYGKDAGVRVARKHIGWYLDQIAGGFQIKTTIFRESDADRQYFLVDQFLLRAAETMEIAA
jgi:tRNA-dihydrouridine synthase B